MGTIAAMDMGEGRITCLIGRRSDAHAPLQVLGGAAGMTGGGGSGAETTSAIVRVIDQAEAAAGETVTHLDLALRGADHIQSFNAHGRWRVGLPGEDNPIASGREILHVVPHGDASAVHVITASSRRINDLMRTVAEAGFVPRKPIYHLLSTASLVLSPKEAALGCLLLDFSEHTTSIGVFCDGGIRHSEEFSFGSEAIAKGRASGLQAFPRVGQIFGIVAESLRGAAYFDRIGFGGAILTGSGLLDPDVQRVVSETFGVRTRIGQAHPKRVRAEASWLSPAYAAALGLLFYAAGEGDSKGARGGR